MNKNDKIEDSLNKIYSTSGYKMVDVSSKEATHRKALAVGEIILSSEVIEMIKNKKMPKGDPLAIAEVSGINGVKKTSELIPLCHPLPLDHISIHTEIDENASQLAGGAASLLALSRALLANPKVLLLDEFADSLDIDTRIKLQDNFSTIASDRTVVDAQNVISHELDSISNYDKIIVLDGGKVVGQGKHEQLIINCEVYRQMLEKEKKLSAIGESKNTGTKEIPPVGHDNF